VPSETAPLPTSRSLRARTVLRRSDRRGPELPPRNARSSTKPAGSTSGEDRHDRGDRRGVARRV